MPNQMKGMRGSQLRRLLWAAGLTGAFAACGGQSLGTAAWTWCKENVAEVDAAATSLQIPEVQTTVREPTWLPDYQTSMANSSIALINANPDFQASCNAAADAAGVGASRVNWCLTDGIGPAWTSADSLGLMTQTDTKTFAYRGITLEKRIDNAEFVQACTSAYTSRT